MRIPALDRKLLRDLRLIRGQAIAIGLVIAAGVSMFVLMLSCFDSLDLTQRTYYDRYRFGDVFASLKRAPRWLEEDIAAIPGVAGVEARVVVNVNLDVPGKSRPAVGRLISIPIPRRAMLCDVYLERGRFPESGRSDEVLVSESFAVANDLKPGDSVVAVINGRRKELQLVGVAQSPEFVYAIRPGEIVSDDSLFGIFWMDRRSLASAFDMEGGFNDVVLTLSRGASESEVISHLDRLLEPYGGFGAMPRSLQPSHFYLQSELDGLRGMGAIVPVIFLGVAAFLLNVVLSRIVAVQREQIAALKAVGYSNGAVALHYLKWSLLIASFGTVAGILVGAWMGAGMTRMYAIFFHFPILEYRLAGGLVAKSILVSLAAATVGALASVRRAVKLPPAEAMRPEPPARYRVGWMERTGIKRWLSQPARIIFRNLQRNPGRALLSVIAIGFGGSMLIVGTFSMDSMDEMMDLQFNVAQRYDAAVTFVEPVSRGAFYEIQRLPGVIRAEPFRSLPVRLRSGHRSRVTAITGLPDDARLQQVIDASLEPVQLPPSGLVLSRKLGEILGTEKGDVVTVEVLTESRPIRQVVVADLIDDYIGINAYMRLEAANRMMREGETLSGAFLQVDEAGVDELFRQVKITPAVAGLSLKGAALKSWEDTLVEMFNMMRSITVIFAAIIAFGVVYNSARISLSERSRELATLRVMGFRRGEIAYILVGELALLVLVAIPLCLALGYFLASLVVRLYDLEVYRLPLIIAPSTYALAAITVVISAVLSALAVRRRLDRLDLIAVLKTRE